MNKDSQSIDAVTYVKNDASCTAGSCRELENTIKYVIAMTGRTWSLFFISGHFYYSPDPVATQSGQNTHKYKELTHILETC